MQVLQGQQHIGGVEHGGGLVKGAGQIKMVEELPACTTYGGLSDQLCEPVCEWCTLRGSKPTLTVCKMADGDGRKPCITTSAQVQAERQ